MPNNNSNMGNNNRTTDTDRMQRDQSSGRTAPGSNQQRGNRNTSSSTSQTGSRDQKGTRSDSTSSSRDVSSQDIEDEGRRPTQFDKDSRVNVVNPGAV